MVKNIGFIAFALILSISLINLAQGARPSKRGTLRIRASSSFLFGASTFKFEGELTPIRSLGTLTASDTRGNRAGWTLNLTASDWVNENGDRMDYDGDGVTTGKFFFLAPQLSNIRSTSGQSTEGLVVGRNASFSSAQRIINILTAPRGIGAGIYLISGIRARQYLPPALPLGTFRMTLTFTLS